MWSEILKRAFQGIAWGGIATFIALTILMLNKITPDISVIWLYALASFVFGIYFGLASFIFEMEAWSPLKKTTVHFLLSVTVYFCIALPLGWVPLTPIAIILSLICFIILYILFWIGFNLYFKKIEASLNESLHRK